MPGRPSPGALARRQKGPGCTETLSKGETMIYKPKGRKHYRIKFQLNGKTIQKRTRVTTAKAARAIEASLRLELEKGNYGILKPRAVITLADFLRKDFVPFNNV